MSYQSKNTEVKDILDVFWNSPANRPILSARGQRKGCDKLLVDGEVFFIMFMGAGGEVTIRFIDPLEISEIITDPDDVDSQKYFKRTYLNQQAKCLDVWYRSIFNQEGEPFPDSTGKIISPQMATQDTNVSFQGYDEALVYHLPFNSIGQRGMPLLLPVLDWIDEYRRMMASRIAIVRALARFAWKQKVIGGTGAVSAAKAVTQQQYPQAGSTWIENAGSDLEPIKADSSAAQSAATDLRAIKLQIAAGVGWPEHYFGDISTGNLATAKTVELPIIRMIESYQQLWSDAWHDIFNVVLDYNDIPEDKRVIDLDFPMVTPQDSTAVIDSITKLITVLPEFANSDDVKMQALMNLGINNTADVLDFLKNQEKGNTKVNLPAPGSAQEAKILKGLKLMREAYQESKKK